MERDDILIAIAKLQSSQDEILRRLEESRGDMKDIEVDLADVRRYMYYAGGALSIISFSWPFMWDYIKSKVGIS